MSDNPFIRAAETPQDTRTRKLASAVQRRAPMAAVGILAREKDAVIAKVLGRRHHTPALRVLPRFPDERRDGIVSEVTARFGEQWSVNQRYPEDSVGRLLGLLNGALVGLVAPVGIFFHAVHNQAANPPALALVVLLAITGAYLTSGVSGVLVPLTLKRPGADPATASGIFLTTATDVTSMGLFRWLAKTIVL